MNFTMSNKNTTKRSKKRELTKKIDRSTVKKLNQLLSYGKGQELANTMKVHYNSIYILKKSSMATPSMIKKLKRGIRKIAA
jgi:hypothetical protein